jgi:flagellar biosynthesis protein FlhA
LGILGKSSKKLAEELPSQLNGNILRKVLQNLLQEGIPVKDMRSIGEALASAAVRSQDPVALTAAVRVALARVIVQGIYGNKAELPVITLDPTLEQILLKAVQQSAQQQSGGFVDDSVVIEPGIAERLQQSLMQAAQRQEIAGNPAVLLVGAPLRSLLSRFVRFSLSGVKVLSYQEIPDNKQITIVATIGQ